MTTPDPVSGRIAYPARLVRQADGGYLISFRDVPEALTEGATRAEAVAEGADALTAALAGYVKAGHALPAATRPRAGEEMIHADAGFTAKMALRAGLKAEGLTPADLARRLGTDHKEARRLLDPDHASKLDRLDLALRAIGYRTVLQVIPLTPRRGKVEKGAGKAA